MQLNIFNYKCQTPYVIKKPIRLIELFAGKGAQAKALERKKANFVHWRICEFDKYAVAIYNAIHGTNFETSDITQTTAADLGITDTDKYEYIMTYSFPCTDLSVAGKQAGMAKGSGTQSGLLWEVERLLKECKELPQVLLMENVPQVLNCDFGGWLEFLEGLGYHNYYQKLNAKDYGIPQNRNRVFMVSTLGDYYYDFPKPIKLLKSLDDIKLPYDKLQEYTKEYFGNKYINTGVLNKALAMGMANIDGDISCCITARSAASANTQYLTRDNEKVTIIDGLELFRLMGFDDSDFYKAKAAGISNSQLYKQAGNSIVVQVLEHIFEMILKEDKQ